MKKVLFVGLILLSQHGWAQKSMTAEMLWKLGKVSGETLTLDQKNVIYGVSNYNIEANKSERNLYSIPINGGLAKQITSTKGSESIVEVDQKTGKLIYTYKGQLYEMNADGTANKQLTDVKDGLENVILSPNKNYIIFTKEVAIIKNITNEKYPDLPKSNAYVYDDLNFRHWDTWEDGKFSHVFYAPFNNGKIGEAIDIMKDEPYDSPQKPFGGLEDIKWSQDGKFIIYVSKKKYGKAYAQSTNTDIYKYEIANKQTYNLTSGMLGYDTQPAFNKDGSRLAWTSMAEDGYESDKNNIMVFDYKTNECHNLTKDWDETVSSFLWSKDETKIYFLAVENGTEQLFEISLNKDLSKNTVQNIKKITMIHGTINKCL